jgi:hypothetical protein
MLKGESKVETTGVPPRRTSVHRTVYLDNGTLLHDNTWGSSYVGEPTVIRVGTKPRPKKKPEQAPKNAEQTPAPPAGETPSTPTTPTTPVEPPVTTAP